MERNKRDDGNKEARKKNTNRKTNRKTDRETNRNRKTGREVNRKSNRKATGKVSRKVNNEVNRTNKSKTNKREQQEKFSYVYEKIKKGEMKLTENQIKAIHRGLKMIASKDPDKASLRNRQGFGAVDSAVGHSLANKTKLNYNEAVKGLKLVFKYRRQLPGWLKKKIFSPYLYGKK